MANNSIIRFSPIRCSQKSRHCPLSWYLPRLPHFNLREHLDNSSVAFYPVTSLNITISSNFDRTLSQCPNKHTFFMCHEDILLYVRILHPHTTTALFCRPVIPNLITDFRNNFLPSTITLNPRSHANTICVDEYLLGIEFNLENIYQI